ncbi:hypothetical protein Tco_0974532 [Tanacetum coccineum]|uniref:Uncharacterized protein n=1 Tax=Tanacetum coccineum TaxID=301880 RepID=A0ABQ5EBW1_9ASTR
MCYPCFTKVIVDYFMAKDQAIPMRNKMFWHYARDDFMFTTIRVISKHKDTQEYGAILPQHLTNQAMLESEAFKTYRAYATGEKAPKSKATKKKTDSESSLKTKPSQASKGKRIKTSAKGDKPDTKNSKGLTVLSEVALSEAEQMKLATKQSLTEFYVSHSSGLGDGVDLQSKVPDEQQQTGFGTNERACDKPEVPDDEGDDFVHPNLSTYKPDDEEEEKEEDDDEVISDQKVSTPPDYELTEEDVNQEDDDTMGEDQEDEENRELYRDLNINLDRQDAEMTDAQTNQETEEAHVTLTTEPPVGQQQSSSVSSYLVAKFINPSLNTELSELKQTNQYAEVVASIPSIVNNYLTSKMKDKVNVALQLKSNKLREEAQAENQDFLNSIDFNMKKIIKEQVKARTSKIMSKVEKYVTETLGAKVLVRSTNQPPTSYAVAYSLLELELKKILMDKMEENKLIDRSEVQKNLYRALLEAYNSEKDLLSSYGEVVILKRGRDDQDKDEEPSDGSNRGSPPKSSGKSVQEEEHDPRVDDLEEPFHQEFDTGNDDVSPVRETTDVDERLWNPSGS